MFGTRVTWELKTSTSSDAPIRLYPDWDYKENDEKQKEFRSTQGGRLHTFTLVGSYQRFNLPLNFVSSEDSNVINGWHQNQTLLHLSINSSIDTSVFEGDSINDLSVRIVNQEKPFFGHSQNQYVKFDGVVILETV